MFRGRFFKIAHGTILVLLIFFLGGQIPYLMKPLSKGLSIVILPLLLGGFLYYLLRPLVRFLATNIKSKSLAIIITILIVMLFFTIVIYFGGSIISDEIQKLINYISLNYDDARENIQKLIKLGGGHLNFLNQFKIQDRAISFMQKLLGEVSNYNFMGVFSSLTNIGTITILIPFVVFYLLKDDERISRFILSFFKGEKKAQAKQILEEIDQVLAVYISSQLIVAFILGLLMFIGYLIIGLPNALALSLIAMIGSLIPVLGLMIAFIPTVLIAITNSWLMVIKLIIVLIITQQLEGNLIRPLVQGDRLNIHPLIVLFLVLISVLLFGILGALFAVPAYAVMRVIIRHAVNLQIE
ncbi:putative permease [Halobacteroides halobius DSM 5150]|uniref:Putative permease n=1 Tax=Halobacteroides halobius (strain ATCC 35273 / DSM 5150 / MD-1) TaxID=748449 RepID=L0K7S4_HALHC|nr:AI-2E family transporter [Halobacteroides halobius]AGB41302.1 putative permease [Halobacteroides halobius DSM 5150]